MGSAGGPITPQQLALAHRVGEQIARRDAVIVTGACPGIPHAAALGSHELGGKSLGVSPAHSREEHVKIFTSPLEPYDAIVFTGSGLMGREVHNIHSSDVVIFIGGRSGTLGEFAIAYDEGKLIGILLDSGGLSDDFEHIAEMCNKNTGSVLLASANPEELVDRCLDLYYKANLPTSTVFDRG
ncbi:MAG: hypothetical protein DLM50_02685 [Candidatus Meridianibacter frigidus]|nr:MAG: hypothetical protein DLM50_02685 [Candidatus Eremiobacteraeota bacterium]